MKQLLLSCRTFAPVFPALVAREYEEDFDSVAFKILWPADACNLTTITIKEMNKDTAGEREKLLKVLTFYFPQLVDVRCGYTGDGSCMRRYRISDDAKLMWWYSGEFFKKLPGELTADAWFGRTFSVDRLVQRIRRAKQSDWTLETDLEDRKGGDGAAESPRPAASGPAFRRTFNSARSCSDACQTAPKCFRFALLFISSDFDSLLPRPRWPCWMTGGAGRASDRLHQNERKGDEEINKISLESCTRACKPDMLDSQSTFHLV